MTQLNGRLIPVFTAQVLQSYASCKYLHAVFVTVTPQECSITCWEIQLSSFPVVVWPVNVNVNKLDYVPMHTGLM